MHQNPHSFPSTRYIFSISASPTLLREIYSILLGYCGPVAVYSDESSAFNLAVIDETYINIPRLSSYVLFELHIELIREHITSSPNDLIICIRVKGLLLLEAISTWSLSEPSLV